VTVAEIKGCRNDAAAPCVSAYILNGLNNGRNAHVVGLEAAAGIEWEIVHLLESLFKKAGEVVKMWVVEVVRHFRSIYVVNLDNRRPARIKKWCLSSACSEWQGNVMAEECHGREMSEMCGWGIGVERMVPELPCDSRLLGAWLCVR
jgi:hypothetical protein